MVNLEPYAPQIQKLCQTLRVKELELSRADFSPESDMADGIVAFRHIIAHGYDVVVDEVVWEDV